MEAQRVLGGRYLLKDKVGSGGMATVYRAEDRVLDRTVAVKIMLPQYAGDATFAARFKQEAQAAAGLSSPYIVGVYDWGKDGDTYYIVMEYLRGTDLKSGIRSHGALDPRKVAQIGSQICGALSVAHKHEIIHRDIKPQNIMVLPDGNIKVMDFGIARAKNSHLTQDNNVLGTAHYVSPEQTRGQELGPTSDIYSLGVVMYECATGRVPFDGDDAISVALKQVNETPVPPSQVNPGVDADLERIILRCMEKDAANRFQTADELRQVLNAYLAGRPVSVPEPTRIIPAAGAGETATRPLAPGETQMVNRPKPGANTPYNTNPGAAGNTDQFPAKKKMSGGKIAAIVVGIIAVVGLVVFALNTLSPTGKSVDVPSVIGWDQKAAVDALKQAGFEKFDITQEYNDEHEEGMVCDQTPDGGKKARTTDTIKLVISKGDEPAKTTKVPDLNGMSKNDAERALKNANLIGNAVDAASDAEKGTVFSQDVAAGTEVDVQTTITYKVSSGPDTTSVPDLTGMTKSQANQALDKAGFGVTFDESYSDTVDKGHVISWNPSGKQEPGTDITVTISLGAEPEPDTVNVDSLNLVGMRQSEAENAIASHDLRYNVSEQASSSVAKGKVISYSPKGEQPKGTTIWIYVSTGPEAAAPAPEGNGEPAPQQQQAQ
ncbi:MAG: Stk1 family PASTA domain-containing Ser/Thr kinase [Coriobacteriaceae bacterium]|nr:Stk1 family PASTA domain-containing Ser/Thr kinase [Coriobacteriaceae bacterium]